MKIKNLFMVLLISIVGSLALSMRKNSDEHPITSQFNLDEIEALTDGENSKFCPPPGSKECFRIVQGATVHIFYSYI